MRAYWKRNSKVLRDGIITSTIMAAVIGGLLSLFSSIKNPIRPEEKASGTVSVAEGGYPAFGRDVDTGQFATTLPPPPLDALPYDVRTPLDNGPDVNVKRRWLWIPDGQTIQVIQDGNDIQVIVPAGAMWWKEFYLTTDRGTFLIERRIILRTETGDVNAQDGWRYYSAYHRPATTDPGQPLRLGSTGDEADRFHFQPTDWLPTQHAETMLEVRFEDISGRDYRYVFPGTAQCTTCHNGAAGAYPNMSDQPIRVFGLHPNNLTLTSFQALVDLGWIENGEVLLTDTEDVSNITDDVTRMTTDEMTPLIVAELRNNCASCHNAAPDAVASFTGFVLDPNYAYTTSELADLLAAPGIMMGTETHPLVSPGSPQESEIILRLTGEEGRRRMPPIEGGAPYVNTELSQLLEAWILALPQSDTD